MSERQYAAHVGLSRGAIQKTKTADRLVLYPDGSINAAASDARRAETTDPPKTRKPPDVGLQEVVHSEWIGEAGFTAHPALRSAASAHHKNARLSFSARRIDRSKSGASGAIGCALHIDPSARMVSRMPASHSSAGNQTGVD